MSSTHTPVDGPFRITVEAIPTGVTLDVESFVQCVVQDVIAALVDDDAYAERLAALYEVQAHDPHLAVRAGDLPVESLVADLVAIVATRIPVYGLQALRLSGRIEQLAAPAISALQAQAEARDRTVESLLRSAKGGAAA